jgi:hypothetical protein
MKRIDSFLHANRNKVLQSSKNIVGVGRGFKIKKGDYTDKPAIIVLVKKKMPEKDLPRGEIIPPKIYDLDTDVIEVGELLLLNRTTYVRPAPPGVSIGHYKISAGTFGAVVKDRRTKKPLILSNNHVLANSSDGQDGRCKIGDPILQPGPYDGGTEEQLIGYLERFVPIVREYAHSSCPKAAALERVSNNIIQMFRPHYKMSFFKKTSVENMVDAALARPISENVITSEILGLGRVKGIREVESGMKLFKSGRSTSVNNAVVKAQAATLKINMGNNEEVVFTDQIVTGPMASPGDSGSLVMDEDNHAVGLLFAGSDSSTIVNRIQNVMDLLDVEF